MSLAPPNDDRSLAWINTHRSMLFHIAYSYCRAPDDRRDLVQEMEIAIWTASAAFDGRGELTTWMYRIALNVAISFYRRNRRHTQHMESLADREDVFAADERHFEDVSDELQMLRAAIRTLDEINRGVILMFFDGVGHDEIASVLGLSQTNVATRISRARAQLTKFLTPPEARRPL